jgi:ammonia channel protein AmtB
MSFVLLKFVAFVFPLRASDSDEVVGLDVCRRREEACVHAGGTESPA